MHNRYICGGFLFTKTVKKMTQHDATRKVQTLRMKEGNDLEVCKKLGISKPTLYSRINWRTNWKITELALIEKLVV